jgi:tetratricopeptide (TPR) repeat protein
MRKFRSSLIALLVASLSSLASFPAAAQEPSPASSTAQADALVRAGRYPEALAEALSAIQRDPSDYKPYYYAAYALYKQNRLDEAAPYAQKALEHAPESDRAGVQRLVDAISNYRSRDQFIQSATEAEQSGLIAKAADIDAQAWKAAPDTSQDLGLKAAHIWVERIPQPLQAATILNYIAAHPQQPAYLEDAQKLLTALQAPLRNVYNSDMNRGNANMQQPVQALASFAEASQAEPQERAPHYMMAQCYMLLNRPDEAMKEILMISRMGGDANEMTQSNVWQESLYQLGVDAQFAPTIRDAFGPGLLAQAQQLDAAQKARQQRADAAAAAAAEKLRIAEEQLPATMARLKVLLSQGKFKTRFNSSGKAETLERYVTSAQNCEIGYQEVTKIYTTATLDETFSLKGLKASRESTRDTNCDGALLGITTSHVAGVSVGDEFFHRKDKPNSYTRTETSLCFDSDRLNDVQEAINLLNEASLACSAH